MYQPGVYSAQKIHWTVEYTTNPNSKPLKLWYNSVIIIIFAATAVYAIVHPYPPAQFLIPSPKSTSTTAISLLGYPHYLLELRINDFIQNRYGPITFKAQTGVAGITINVPQLLPQNLPCDYSYSFKLVNVQ